MRMWSPFYQVTDSERTYHLIEITKLVTSGGGIRTHVSVKQQHCSHSLYPTATVMQYRGQTPRAAGPGYPPYVTLLHCLENYYSV